MKQHMPMRKLKKHTRNREQTKQAFVHAVKTLIARDGFDRLTLSAIAKEAGRSISLIYTYFGNLEGLLIVCYFSNDYWLAYDKEIDKLIGIHQDNFCRELAVIVIKRLFTRLMHDTFLQRIVLLEITVHDELLRKLDEAREKMGDKLFAVAEPYFENTSVDIHSVIAILTSAVGHLVLHYVHKPGPYCKVDLRRLDHQEKLLVTIRQLVYWAFDQAARDQAAFHAI